MGVYLQKSHSRQGPCRLWPEDPRYIYISFYICPGTRQHQSCSQPGPCQRDQESGGMKGVSPSPCQISQVTCAVPMPEEETGVGPKVDWEEREDGLYSGRQAMEHQQWPGACDTRGPCRPVQELGTELASHPSCGGLPQFAGRTCDPLILSEVSKASAEAADLFHIGLGHPPLLTICQADPLQPA